MKFSLLCLIATVLFLLPEAMLHAQTAEPDKLILKDGKEIKGTIIETAGDRIVKIRTADSTVYIYQMVDIQTMSKNSQSSKDLQSPSGNESRSDQTGRFNNTLVRSIFLHCGLSIPSGTFSDAKSAEGGGAVTGFAIGADADMHAGEKLSFMMSLDCTFNSFNMDPLLEGSGLTAETGSWTCIWALAGLKCYGDISPTAKLFVFGQGGLLISSSPDYTVNSNILYGESFTQSSGSGTTFGYGLGAGIRAGNLVMSARFLGGKPVIETEISSGRLSDRVKFKQSIACILITAGIVL